MPWVLHLDVKDAGPNELPHSLVCDLPVVRALAAGPGTYVAVVRGPLPESFPTAGASAGAGSSGGEVDLDPLSTTGGVFLADTSSSAPVRSHALVYLSV